MLRLKGILLLAFVAAVGFAVSAAGTLRAQNQPTLALAGKVTGLEGTPEGVLVNAWRTGSNMMVTVVTDAQGRYRFPSANLQPGDYAISIRADGYDLVGPSAVVVNPGATTTADLKLTKAARLEDQISNAEWLYSAPGTLEQKNDLLDCTGCHTLQRVFDSYHTADDWKNNVLPRMTQGYSNNTFWLKPQAFGAHATRQGYGFPPGLPAYLASINQSSGPRQWALKTFPRLTGVSGKVILTTYMLPSKLMQPHDVIGTPDGKIWFDDFGGQYLGWLDQKTGKVTMYDVPAEKPGYIMGNLELDRDPGGRLWLAGMFQGQIVSFDPSTAKFTQYPIPPAKDPELTQESMVMPLHDNVDGRVWTNNQDEHQFVAYNLNTGKYEVYPPLAYPDNPKKIFSAYGELTDDKNTIWGLNFGSSEIGHFVPPNKLTIYYTPTKNSRPRRGRVDDRTGILWFAEFAGNNIGSYDTNVENGTIKEYPLPTPFQAPYDVVADHNGQVWSGSMLTDRIDRLDPKTGKVTEYQLPWDTNIRRVWVDNTTKPVTLWIGNNHGGSVIRLQPTE